MNNSEKQGYTTSYKRNRSRKPITLEEAKLRMTDAIAEMEAIIATEDNKNRKINATNALSGLVSRYAKLAEVAELKDRVEELEKELEATQKKLRAEKERNVSYQGQKKW